MVFRITFDSYVIDVEYHDAAFVMKDISDNIVQLRLLDIKH